MKSVIAFLRLIRAVNLLFVALTQYLVQYAVIRPILAQAGLQPTLDDLHFSLLVIATILVAAAGYVINDYFDVQMDEINKPRRIFIDRTIHRRSAMLLHQILTGSGVLLALYVAWHVGNLKLGFVHAIVAAFLWFYSTGYKRKFLVGTILVSFLTGLVILIVGLYEKNIFQPADAASQRAAYAIIIILFFYFVFSFLISLARELVKDLQDMKGDRLYQSRTVPIIYGIQKTKWMVYGILTVMLAMLIYIQSIEVRGRDFISALTIFTTIEFPACMSIYLLSSAITPRQFSAVSGVIKIVMFMGILSMLYFFLLMRK